MHRINGYLQISTFLGGTVVKCLLCGPQIVHLNSDSVKHGLSLSSYISFFCLFYFSEVIETGVPFLGGLCIYMNQTRGMIQTVKCPSAVVGNIGTLGMLRDQSDEPVDWN